MNTGTLCCLNHLLGVNLCKTGNIFSNRAIKQLNILRKIADMRPKFHPVPTLYRLTINQNPSCPIRPHPDNATGKC